MHLLALALSTPAYACGGMFCDAVNPVDQAAERILFAFDGDEVTVEVQITYDGRDDNFAWVVPVPGEPELFVSNDALFTQIANLTVPTFSLTSDQRGGGGIGCTQDYALSAEKGVMDSAYDGVSVVSESTVGPYDTVVLQADDSDVLVTWLQDQGYNLPSTLDAALAPYVASGQYFVALKLSSDKDTGDLAPLGMRYPATSASIPLQLTSIAAIPDLPVEVFVLGESRAVPENYLHVEINEAAIDWYNAGSNYRDVVARAADEAGGQAFATDYSGSTDILASSLWWPGMIDTDYLKTVTDPISWVESIVFSGMPGSSQLNALLVSYVEPPADVDDATFLACPSCYGTLTTEFDPVVATEALQTEILDVLQEEQERLDAAPHLTRLFTMLSPEEMTADPMFVFNDDIEQDVPSAHFATDVTQQALFSGDTVARTLVLDDGRSYKLSDPNKTGELSAVEDPAALVIADLGASGEGTVLFDGTADAELAARRFSGCGGSGAEALAPIVILLGAFSRRRR